MTTSTTTGARTIRRFVDPEDLICPGCGEQAIGAHVQAAVWLPGGSVHEVADEFGVSERTALRWARSGRTDSTSASSRGDQSPLTPGALTDLWPDGPPVGGGE